MIVVLENLLDLIAIAARVLSIIFRIAVFVAHAVTIFGALVQTEAAPFSFLRTFPHLLQRGGSRTHSLERLRLSEEVATS